MTLDVLEIFSQRLRLVAIDCELSGLQLRNPETFFEKLGVPPPSVWPPDLMDRAALEWAHARLESNPGSHGWLFWIFILNGREGEADALCGAGGFKGPPDDTGTVEIGFSVLADYRSKGIASEAAQALIDWAARSGEVRRIIGHTLPDLIASRRVLEKTGFEEEITFFDEDEQLEVVRYGLNLR